MRLACVNQDPGVGPDREKGAAVHLREMRSAFDRLGAEVTSVDHSDPLEVRRQLEQLAASGPLDLVYERYALGAFAAGRFARERGLPHVLEVNAPLLSRCKVLVLKALEQTDITELIKKSLPHIKLPPDTVVEIDDDTIEFISGFSHGDAREALNTLENAALIATPDKDGKIIISIATAKEAMQKQALRYDKSGEEHYNIVSAFIKSMRGSDPDASLYWLSRMVEAGEDPLFIARRMVVFASEDVGNADPAALTVAMGVKEAVQFIGMPEGWIPLAQGTTYLATADKSNASYTAYKLAKGDVTEHGNLPVPLHLRNAPTKLMKKLGYGEGYKYPHNYKDARAEQQYMPDELKDKKYYTAPSPAQANKTENKEKKKK